MVNISLVTRFYTSRLVVWDFFQQPLSPDTPQRCWLDKAKQLWSGWSLARLAGGRSTKSFLPGRPGSKTSCLLISWLPKPWLILDRQLLVSCRHWNWVWAWFALLWRLEHGKDTIEMIPVSFKILCLLGFFLRVACACWACESWKSDFTVAAKSAMITGWLGKKLRSQSTEGAERHPSQHVPRVLWFVGFGDSYSQFYWSYPMKVTNQML